MQTLLHELTGNMHSLTSFGSTTSDVTVSLQGHDQQQLPMGDMQLPSACLHLLVALVQHSEDVRKQLLDDSDR